ncbi:hypothetical protein PHYPSEUDO_012389 [Phytophthora pseudosyringae]|uniref:Ubiquitin-like protease family profile domain-containing protein n=1 Tax=Phytophthora pseudosyringae TaxID=221518 RepID=A0A8T1V9F2_9STRA|nr:hypothetical protein PHYPSEUDO_012389 [Phytophthora pseudosyringae]
MRARYDNLLQSQEICVWWTRDLAWLVQDWSKVTSRSVEFFAHETASCGRAANEAQPRLVQLASVVVTSYVSYCMQSQLYKEDASKEICFNQVVGFLAEDAWLNDAVISYALAVMSEDQNDVHIMSSLVVERHKYPNPPRLKQFSMKFIMLHVIHASNHWTLVIVAVQRYEVVRVPFYDPVSGGQYKEKMEAMCSTKFLPYLRAWHSQRNPNKEGGETYPFPSSTHM